MNSPLNETIVKNTIELMKIIEEKEPNMTYYLDDPRFPCPTDYLTRSNELRYKVYNLIKSYPVEEQTSVRRRRSNRMDVWKINHLVPVAVKAAI